MRVWKKGRREKYEKRIICCLIEVFWSKGHIK